MQLQGKLNVDDKGWHFDGGLGADKYNFKREKPGDRSPVAEGLTYLGSLLPGKPYEIMFQGQKPMKGQGTW